MINSVVLLSIVKSNARSLLTLARLAGASPAFFRGADFRNADLRNEDFRGFDLTGASFKGAILDENTKVDLEFENLIAGERPIRVSVPVDLKNTLGKLRDYSRKTGKTIPISMSEIVDFYLTTFEKSKSRRNEIMDYARLPTEISSVAELLPASPVNGDYPDFFKSEYMAEVKSYGIGANPSATYGEVLAKYGYLEYLNKRVIFPDAMSFSSILSWNKKSAKLKRTQIEIWLLSLSHKLVSEFADEKKLSVAQACEYIIVHYLNEKKFRPS